MLRPSVSVIQIAGSGANVRQPVLSGSPPAAKERRHAREDAGHERDSSIHLHPHADNHPSPKASRRAFERPDPDLASFGTEHPDRPQTVPAVHSDWHASWWSASRDPNRVPAAHGRQLLVLSLRIRYPLA